MRSNGVFVILPLRIYRNTISSTSDLKIDPKYGLPVWKSIHVSDIRPYVSFEPI